MANRYATIVEEIDKIAELCEAEGQTEVSNLLDEVTAELVQEEEAPPKKQPNLRNAKDAKALRDMAHDLKKAGETKLAKLALKLAAEMEDTAPDAAEGEDGEPEAEEDKEDEKEEEDEEDEEDVESMIAALEAKIAAGEEDKDEDKEEKDEDEDKEEKDDKDDEEDDEDLAAMIAKLEKELEDEPATTTKEDEPDATDESDEDPEGGDDDEPAVSEPKVEGPEHDQTTSPKVDVHAAKRAAARTIRRIASKLRSDGQTALAKRVEALNKAL